MPDECIIGLTRILCSIVLTGPAGRETLKEQDISKSAEGRTSYPRTYKASWPRQAQAWGRRGEAKCTANWHTHSINDRSKRYASHRRKQALFTGKAERSCSKTSDIRTKFRETCPIGISSPQKQVHLRGETAQRCHRQLTRAAASEDCKWCFTSAKCHSIPWKSLPRTVWVKIPP